MGGKGSEASGTRIEMNVAVEGAIDLRARQVHDSAEESPARGV